MSLADDGSLTFDGARQDQGETVEGNRQQGYSGQSGGRKLGNIKKSRMDIELFSGEGTVQRHGAAVGGVSELRQIVNGGGSGEYEEISAESLRFLRS